MDFAVEARLLAVLAVKLGCYLLTPAVAGGLAGRLLARLFGPCRGVGLAVAAWSSVPLAVFLLAALTPALPPADSLLLVGLFTATCLRVAGHRAPVAWSSLALLVGSLLVSAAGAEWAVRQWLPAPRYYPVDPRRLGLTASAHWGEGLAAGMAFGLQDGVAAFGPPSSVCRGQRVLHLSDSMGLGLHGDGRRSFIHYLDQLRPDECHISGAVGGTGPDFYSLTAHNWVARHRADAVVFHLAVSGDLLDLGRAYAFCCRAPLVTGTGADFTFLCPDGPCNAGLIRHLLTGPAPLPVRGLGWFSFTARHLDELWERLTRGLCSLSLPDGGREELLFSVMEELLSFLRTHEIPSAVVLHVHRDHLMGKAGPGGEGGGEEWANRLAGQGWTVVDPTAMLLEEIAARGDDALYRNDVPGDGHYDRRGHLLMAAFLDDHLDLVWSAH